MSTQAILQRNRMTYEVNQPTSVKTRPYDIIEQPFSDQQYNSGETGICHFPTGKYFVDSDKSYLVLKCTITAASGATTSAGFGSGSAQNLIKDIRLFHRSGTTISSTQDRDVYVKARDYIVHDKFWFDTIGVIEGYKSPVLGPVLSTDAPVTLKIPLSELHGFFKGHNSRLLPPEIIRDLRMELVFNNLETALYKTSLAPPITSLVIEPELQICLVKAMDSAIISVENVSNKTGLSWTYDDVFVTNKIQLAADQIFNSTIEKSVSVANNIITFARYTDVVKNQSSNSYVFNIYNGVGNSWMYTLGNDMYPYKKKITTGVDTYTCAIDAFKTQYGLNMKYLDDFSAQNWCYVTNLMSDDYLEMSGDFINSNKRLQFEKFTGSVPEDNRWTSCLSYTKVLRVNSNSSRVDE
jgi:hypothetical protein